MTTTPRGLVVIVGAARSGTKLLRGRLGAHRNASEIPHDINFVWRLGNERYPNDELPPSLALPRVTRRIRRAMARWWTEDVLVEKTVSNALRVAFVDEVFPEARFVHLVRDGYDVVESSYRQWLASPDWRYLARKAREVGAFSPTLAPRYAARAVSSAVRRQLRRGRASGPVPMWGPVYDGMEDDVRTSGVLAAVAWQWRKCVELATSALAELPAERVFAIDYETFVQQPDVTLRRLRTFCGLDPPASSVTDLSIRTSELGKGRRSLPPEQRSVIAPIIEPARASLGYA